jgi:hypothetical protein
LVTDFLADFFVVGFFAARFAVFFAFLPGLTFLTIPAFLTARLAFLERFPEAAAFADRGPADLRAFFVFVFEVFFLGVATTKSFMARTNDRN